MSGDRGEFEQCTSLPAKTARGARFSDISRKLRNQGHSNNAGMDHHEPRRDARETSDMPISKL